MISINTSPVDVANQAIDHARFMCEREFGDSPMVSIRGRKDLTFAYVPSHLYYMLFELLKNSMRATCDMYMDEDGMYDGELPDINIIIADGEENEDVVIKVSDAGGGIGYTGIRIRGSDANRINVTINGIPYNDTESHGVFWVDLPDIASSTNTIQIQRGVGPSTNGGGAFGGTISIKTGTPSEKAYINYATSIGSFKTFKNTLNLNSGLFKQHWNFTLRLSKITSDGYVDRAFSNLWSYYAAATYFTKKKHASARKRNGLALYFSPCAPGPFTQ